MLALNAVERTIQDKTRFHYYDDSDDIKIEWINKMTKLGDKIRLGIMCGFLALVAYVWIEAIVLINMA